MKGDAKPYIGNLPVNESPDAAEDCASNVLVIKYSLQPLQPQLLLSRSVHSLMYENLGLNGVRTLVMKSLVSGFLTRKMSWLSS